MTLPAYNFSASSDSTVFEFISKGRLNVKKRVRMEEIDPVENIYNLALCTISEDGSEDCNTASRNGDMLPIFYTIAYIAIYFTDKYPDRKIYFTGSDILRTRTYQFNIYNAFDLISGYFAIEGLTIENDELKGREDYQKGKNYQAFIFTRIN